MNKLICAFAATAALIGMTSLNAAPKSISASTSQQKSVVAQLNNHVKVFRDGKYTPTTVKNNADYYVVYYSASW